MLERGKIGRARSFAGGMGLNFKILTLDNAVVSNSNAGYTNPVINVIL